LGSYTNPVLRAGGTVLIMRGLRKQMDECLPAGPRGRFSAAKATRDYNGNAILYGWNNAETRER